MRFVIVQLYGFHNNDTPVVTLPSHSLSHTWGVEREADLITACNDVLRGLPCHAPFLSWSIAITSQEQDNLPVNVVQLSPNYATVLDTRSPGTFFLALASPEACQLPSQQSITGCNRRRLKAWRRTLQLENARQRVSATSNSRLTFGGVGQGVHFLLAASGQRGQSGNRQARNINLC
jgi:hypothetical protein